MKMKQNEWIDEPGINASWLSSKLGLELSAFVALDFSTRDDATDYQSGDVLHLDATVAQHLPLLGRSLTDTFNLGPLELKEVKMNGKIVPAQRS